MGNLKKYAVTLLGATTLAGATAKIVDDLAFKRAVKMAASSALYNAGTDASDPNAQKCLLPKSILFTGASAFSKHEGELVVSITKNSGKDISYTISGTDQEAGKQYEIVLQDPSHPSSPIASLEKCIL